MYLSTENYERITTIIRDMLSSHVAPATLDALDPQGMLRIELLAIWTNLPEKSPDEIAKPEGAVSEGRWAIVEQLGHVRLAGLVTEVTIAGQQLLHVAIPAAAGRVAWERYVGPQTLYALTPCTEDEARAEVAGYRTSEASSWVASRGTPVRQITRELQWEDNDRDDDQGGDDDNRDFDEGRDFEELP